MEKCPSLLSQNILGFLTFPDITNIKIDESNLNLQPQLDDLNNYINSLNSESSTESSIESEPKKSELTEKTSESELEKSELTESITSKVELEKTSESEPEKSESSVPTTIKSTESEQSVPTNN